MVVQRKALILAVTAAVLLGAGIVVGMLLDNGGGDGNHGGDAGCCGPVRGGLL